MKSIQIKNTILLAFAVLFLSIFAGSSIACCCDKHKNSDYRKNRYVFEYDGDQEVETKQSIDALQKKLIEKEKTNLKIVSTINAKDTNEADKKFKIALERAEKIKAQLVKKGINQDRLYVQIRVFLGSNPKNLKDKVTAYEIH